MDKSARSKADALERILHAHTAWERRTLADLRTAGYKFTTVDQAKRWLKASQTVARMSPEEVIEMVARRPGTRGTKQ